MRKITDCKTFSKTVKPFLSDKAATTKKYFLPLITTYSNSR